MNDLQFIRTCLSLALTDSAEVKTEEIVFPEDWLSFYKFCSRHGIMGFVLDGIIRINDTTCPRAVHKMMVANVIMRETIFERRLKEAGELAALLAQRRIRMVILKGFSFASLYANPSRRVSSDLDCFLFDGYETCNRLMEEHGVSVDRSHYKHSNFKFKSLTVENHRFCTPVRGSKKTKVLENKLQELLNSEPMTPIMGTEMLCPGPMFNALFYMAHARSHFILEGMALRQIIDWTVIKRSLPDDFDWSSFNSYLEISGMKLFADTIDEVASFMIKESDSLTDLGERVLKDICHNTGSITYHQGIRTTIQIVRRALSSGWKYRYFSENTMLSYLMKAFLSRIFEKTPQLR